MKNYKEMAQSVLKRRDIGIKRRRRALLIGAPCAAAVLVGVAGIGTAVAANNRGRYINPVVDIQPGPMDGFAEIGAAEGEIAEAASSADIAAVEPEQIDYTNPNVGQTNINVTYLEDIHLDNGANVDGCDFNEYTLDELDRFYRLRFSRLTTVYPDWEVSYDKLGTYTKDTKTDEMWSHAIVSTRNTLTYTTEYGGKVTVIVQNEQFEPLANVFAEPETETSVSEPEVHIEYDENGNVIGMSTPSYDPAASRPADYSDPDNGKSRAYNSVINGYDAAVFGQLSKDRVSGVDVYIADIEMASHVRIIAEGVTYMKFEEILDNFTNNIEGPFKVTDKITNPNVGQNEINVLEIDRFNITDESIDFSDGTFYEYTLEELDKIYNLRFNILGELHSDWKLSHDKLGAYNAEYTGHGIFIHNPDSFCTFNTLNYITSSGAKISVSVDDSFFEPISDERLTFMKLTDPSQSTSETLYDDNGNPIGYLSKPIDPNEPDEGISTVNGCEALIYRNADGNFLAGIDMGYSCVRITAEGLSEEEFLEILDEFTKYKL